MNLHIEDLLEGFDNTLHVLKQADNSFFESAQSTLFPTANSQQKWRYSKSHNFIRLHDGNTVFNFHAPAGISTEEDFLLERKDDIPTTEFESGALQKGTVQVHRSDPGSIYFTLQEGRQNPTYTLRHIGGSQWKAIPKKKKKPAIPSTIPNINPEQVKKAMEEFLEKQGFSLGKALSTAGNTITDTAMSPGYDPLAAAGIGGLAGLGYHVGKRTLYNSPAENEEEGLSDLLLRVGAPAAVLGLTGLAQKNIMNPDFYNQWRASGLFNNPNKLIPQNGNA